MPGRPAPRVPVPALLDAADAVRRPHDDVRRARPRCPGGTRGTGTPASRTPRVSRRTCHGRPAYVSVATSPDPDSGRDSRSRRRRLARGMGPSSQTGRRPRRRPGGQPVTRALVRVVQRAERDAGRMPGAGDVDLPRAVGEPLRRDRAVVPDEGEADRPAERPAVRGRAHLTDDDAVAQHRLGVEEQRLGVVEEHLHEPVVRRPPLLRGCRGVPTGEPAGLVERHGEPEARRPTRRRCCRCRGRSRGSPSPSAGSTGRAGRPGGCRAPHPRRARRPTPPGRASAGT